MNRVYLDWNATTPLRPQAREAMLRAMDTSGNPSSVHSEGRAAHQLIDSARRDLGALLGVPASSIVFTSGGTEANALAQSPGWSRGEPVQRLIVSAVEHPSVLSGGRFTPDRIEIAPVDGNGVINLTALEQMLAGRPPALVSLMLANNETGAIQPVADAARLVHDNGGILHVDAVQAFGKIPINISELGADLLTISAHKIGGPKGAGALVLANAALSGGVPLWRGGGQEMSRRSGTENVVGIAGFAAAARVAVPALAAEATRLAGLRDRLEQGLLKTPGASIVSRGARRLPNTCLFTVPGMAAETAVISFDLEGIAVSSGAACSSGKVQLSHVLSAMGVEARQARGALRISLGWETTDRDIECCLEAWIKLSTVLLKAPAGTTV